MNLKSLSILGFAGLSLCAYCATLQKAELELSDEARARHEAFLKMSPAEKEKYLADRKAKVAERSGGYVRNTAGQEGRVLVANAQERVSIDTTTQSLKKLADQLKIAIDVEYKPGASPEKASELLAEKDTCAVILVVDNANCDIPLLIAPDSQWASVNVHALGDGDIAGRAHKEILRAFTFLCGGIASSYQNPMTYPVINVKQLDLIDSADLPIDVIMRFSGYLKALGVTPYIQATYRSACKQGWAPAPTNDVQRAIWDKVHSIPATPMKIEFDPKKGR